MEDERLDEREETRNETEPLLRPETSPTYLHFRPGREPHRADRFTAFVLSVFKVSFCSLGLWGHQTWNYIPRVVFSAICIFQALYWICQEIFHINGNPLQHSARACFTLLPLAALLSYAVFSGCFIAARRKDSALVSPSETMLLDIQRMDIFLLFLAFVFISISFLIWLVVFVLTGPLAIGPDVRLKFEVAAVAAQYLAHWASVNTCHVFAVSCFTLGKLLNLSSPS